MSQMRFVLSFDEASADDANRYAAELQEMLLSRDPGITVEQARDDENAQDFGATLILILGAPAVVRVASGIADYLRKRTQVSISVKSPKGEVVATGVNYNTAVELVEQVFKDL
jgi:hypothetical protein